MFTLQPVVLEYVTERLVEAAAGEVARGRAGAAGRASALIKATAKDYVRRSQERLIGAPILEHLEDRRGRDDD